MEATVLNMEDTLPEILKEQIGTLWIALKFTGIIPFSNSRQKVSRYVYIKACELFFPFLLLCNLIYCWYVTMKGNAFAYPVFLDSLIPLFTNILWCFMYLRRNSLRNFMNGLANSTLTASTPKNRYLPLTVKAALCFAMIYPPFLMSLRFFQNNKVETIDMFRYLQEIIFPSIVTLLYTTICYVLLQNVRSCKNMIHTKLDITCHMAVKNFRNIYLSIIKDAEMFEDSFSCVAFIVILKNFCVVSYIMTDMMNDPYWIKGNSLEASFYLAFNLLSTGALTAYAASIPLEMLNIKSMLLDKLSEQSLDDRWFVNGKQLRLLLRRRVCTLTACGMFSFDRGFLPKALATVIAHLVAFDHLQLTCTTSSQQVRCMMTSFLPLKLVTNLRSCRVKLAASLQSKTAAN
ncbi:hypothetical protein AVEN_207624-1 [Araneus ventricosus]|uniref:Gustatory receptor n=1 Tax=Araneus ventricosus TaxID=182803 RepID=A0A4Y2HAB3_ARAVE|nr:hypothetical protein AVEN_207624-1 [Araneus ventricosus]